MNNAKAIKHELSPEKLNKKDSNSIIGPILTVDKFRSFLTKMKKYSVQMVGNMFKHYSKIFEKEFKLFFRSKSNIFTKFQGDLEKKIKMRMGGIFTDKNLIFQFLDVPQNSFQDTSLSAYFNKQIKRELLSRNFSSIFSVDRKRDNDSLSLILEYSNSFTDEMNKDLNVFDDGKKCCIFLIKRINKV